MAGWEQRTRLSARARRLGGGRAALALALGAALTTAVGCGDSDEDTTSTQAEAPGGQAVDLAAVKDYLTEHSAELSAQTEELKRLGESYYELAESADSTTKR